MFSFLKHKTRLFSCLDFVVWFFLLCFLNLFFLPKNRKKKNGYGRNPQNQKCRKTPRNVFQLVQLCSQINSVANLLGWASKMQICAQKHDKKMVSANVQTAQNDRTLSKFEGQKLVPAQSKTGPSMLHKIIGPIFDL